MVGDCTTLVRRKGEWKPSLGGGKSIREEENKRQHLQSGI